jgi:uncharacterized protein (DUF1697 family)
MAAPLVVFMRAVNVGGHQSCKPARLAAELSAFGVVNIGAAGTFVVRQPPAAAILEAEIRSRLPFDTGLMLCPAREFHAAAAAVHSLEVVEGAFPMLTVLAKPVGLMPLLPIDKPAGDRWEMRIALVAGRYVWSLYRRLGPRPLNLTAFVEKTLGVAGTTRNLNTITAIQAALDSPSPGGSGTRGRVRRA